MRRLEYKKREDEERGEKNEGTKWYECKKVA